MLDTVAITLNPRDFILRDHDAFNPSARGILEPPYVRIKKQGISCVYNPNKEQKEAYGYLPRLTLMKRPGNHGFRIGLRIEFSAPKLLLGNNFDELSDKDFTRLCKKLSTQLRHMKVDVSPANLAKAAVSAIHYSKNLPLTDHTSCSMVIREIAKSAHVKSLDSTKTEYRNDGSAFKLHANSHEVILYDKLKDLEKANVSKKRSFETDGDGQLNLLEKSLPKPLEVLRIEARIGNRTKLEALFLKLGIKCELNFESLFSSAISKPVLKHYWRMMTPDMPILACSKFSADDLYDAILKSEPTMKAAKILEIVGAFALIAKIGMSGLSVLIRQHSTPRTWQRLKALLLQQTVTAKMKYSPIQIAEGHLEAFAPLRLKNLKPKSVGKHHESSNPSARVHKRSGGRTLSRSTRTAPKGLLRP